MSDYEGPDRRQQTDALADAVGRLDESVFGLAQHASALRQDVARERRWRRLTVAVVAVLVPVAVSSVVGVFQNRQTNQRQDEAVSILRNATAPATQATNRYTTALLICDLKADVRIALAVLHPDAEIPEPANCPPTPPPTTP